MLAIILGTLTLALALGTGLLVAMAAHRVILAWRFRDVRRGLLTRWDRLAPAAKHEVLKALGIRFFSQKPREPASVAEGELDRLFGGVLASGKAALRDHSWLDVALLEEELSLAFEAGPADEAQGLTAGGGVP